MYYPPNSYGNVQPTTGYYPPMQPVKQSWWSRQKRWRKIILLGCALPLVLCFLCICSLAAIGLANPSKQQANQPIQEALVPSPTATHAPTPKPTQAAKTPVPTATSAPASHGPAVLGATLADFEAHYGPLNSYSNPSKGEYYFSLYGQGKDDLTISFTNNMHVDLAILGASDSNQGWNESDAVNRCLTLLPSDATKERQMNVTGGDLYAPDIQRVYLIPSLASLFPASAFTDENGNQTTVGTVGMILNADTTNGLTSYLSCTVQVGLQQN